MEFKHRDDEDLLCQAKKTVFISSEQYENMPLGKFYGKFYKETGIFNVFPERLYSSGDFLGIIIPENETIPSEGLVGIRKNKSIDFIYDGESLSVELHSIYMDVFSRNSGILETDMMSKKGAVILGCGSVGSLVAVELVKSGVGNIFLVDPDIVEYHNLARHQCGISDVGDLKVNALKRKLLNINPSLNITISSTIVENTSKELLKEFCEKNDKNLFVGCADNRIADVYSNQIAIYFNASFISIGFWERAYAGEIFYHIPSKNMPCYYCALGDGGGFSKRAIANHHVYSMEENIEEIKFEPGISVDINFITIIGVKLSLDLLNTDEKGYIPRLLNNLNQYTVICNTSDPKIGGEMVEIFSYPLQVTTSLEVLFNNSRCDGICKYEKNNDDIPC